MRSTLLVMTALLAVGTTIATKSKRTTIDFSFSTVDNKSFPTRQHKTLRRNRHLTQQAINKKIQKEFKPRSDALESIHGEERTFWNRMLADEYSSIQPSPAAPTGPAPTAAAPSAPPPTAAAPTAPPPTAPPPTSPPARCPTTLEVECLTVDGSQNCVDVPTDGSRCSFEVEYSYFVVNKGDSVQRLYSLVINRGGEVNDQTGIIPVTDIEPGDTEIILQNDIIDVCVNGIEAFNTEAAFTVGPPSEVEVTIECFSAAGDECRSLPQAESPEECMIDITYTYTVANIGPIDANIILFTRTRNGEFADLITLLDSTYLPLGATTSVEETEEIDRCVQQSFATNTVVAQIPNADLLCEDVGRYP